jgi:pimeloyl-ACP methyl ester carboxylesterase
MATFVLVHGAWHGGWCWSRVRRVLQSGGHQVHTPTLSGLCERSHLLSREIGLTTHVADVANLISWEGLEDVVLCGHSYGGCVISGVAHRERQRISALVYLDAFILEDGQSLLATLPPEQREANLELARQAGEGWKIPPIPAAAFNVNEADRDWVDRQCTPQPLLTFTESLELPHGLPESARKSFVYASGWGDTPFAHFRTVARHQGWSISDLDCGHDVMLDQPDQVAERLLAAAESVRRG